LAPALQAPPDSGRRKLRPCSHNTRKNQKETNSKSSGNVSETQCAVFAFDVSKDSLNFFTRIGAKAYERCFRNRSDVVEAQLAVMVELAKKAGMEKILVVAKSTGKYQEILMRTARKIGIETA
jgi:hypothetical protein